MLIVVLLLLPGLQAQEVTPSNFIEQTTAKNFRFQPVKFLKSVKPVKKGPILFPSGPPPAPTPLVVTSRPLIDSIRRSDLNPNNTIQASSQINQVAYSPEYLGRTPGYLDRNSNSIAYVDSPTPDYDNEPYRVLPVNSQQGSSSRPLIYRGLQNYPSEQKKTILPNTPYYEYRDSTPEDTTYYLNKPAYGDQNKYYAQERTNLSPIYRVLSHQTNQQNFQHSTPQPKPIYEYQKPENTDYNQVNADQTTNDHSSGDNYAFSYAVKDRQTGDDFSHSQSSSGSATNGEYRVRLPDGRMQIVSYTADEGGYKAEVRYDDEHKPNEYNSNSNNGNQDNRYINHQYTINDPKDINTNNNFGNFNSRNVFIDYLDKSHQSDPVKPNQHLILGNIYNNQNQNGVYRNDKISDNNHYSGDAFNVKVLEPKLDDYGRSSGEASTEYKDYSSEAISYQPYKSKYSEYFKPNDAIKSTVIPPYAELKNVFVTQNPRFSLVSPTRFQPEAIETATEEVVVIGDKKPNLFTNIRNILSENSVTPKAISYTTISPSVVTPTNFLYSTIANLRNKLNLSVKPILSQAYINKINKYLDFKF